MVGATCVVSTKLWIVRLAICGLETLIFFRGEGFYFWTIWPQALAIQVPGMIASVWPDWVILPYIIGAEITVE